MEDLPQPTTRSAQWKCDNQDEIEVLLEGFAVRTEIEDDCLRITGLGGLDIELKPGDCLIQEGERLGVMPVPDEELPVPMRTVNCEVCGNPTEVTERLFAEHEVVAILCDDDCREKYLAAVEDYSGETDG